MISIFVENHNTRISVLLWLRNYNIGSRISDFLYMSLMYGIM